MEMLSPYEVLAQIAQALPRTCHLPINTRGSIIQTECSSVVSHASQRIFTALLNLDETT